MVMVVVVVVVVAAVGCGIEVEVCEGEFWYTPNPLSQQVSSSGGLVLDARTQKNHQCNQIRREIHGLPCQMPSTKSLI
jgi:hypothetical protein